MAEWIFEHFLFYSILTIWMYCFFSIYLFHLRVCLTFKGSVGSHYLSETICSFLLFADKHWIENNRVAWKLFSSVLAAVSITRFIRTQHSNEYKLRPTEKKRLLVPIPLHFHSYSPQYCKILTKFLKSLMIFNIALDKIDDSRFKLIYFVHCLSFSWPDDLFIVWLYDRFSARILSKFCYKNLEQSRELL